MICGIARDLDERVDVHADDVLGIDATHFRRDERTGVTALHAVALYPSRLISSVNALAIRRCVHPGPLSGREKPCPGIDGMTRWKRRRDRRRARADR